MNCQIKPTTQRLFLKVAENSTHSEIITDMDSNRPTLYTISKIPRVLAVGPETWAKDFTIWQKLLEENLSDCRLILLKLCLTFLTALLLIAETMNVKPVLYLGHSNLPIN